MGEFPFIGAWQPVGGKWYLKLSKPLLKQLESGLGDWVHVRFNLDDPNAVDLPEGLSQALAVDEEFRKAWELLTPGKQGSWALPVSQARGAATIEERVRELRRALVKAGLG